MEQTFNPLIWLVLMFLAHNVGIFGAFYVYDDARKRYLSQFWAIGWSVCVYAALIIFLWFYLILRPPIFFDNAPKLSIKKKVIIYFSSFPLVIALIMVIAFISM